MSHDRLRALDDYQSGAMSDAEAEAFEEALFDGEGAAEAAFVDRVARLSAWLVDRGTFFLGHTRGEVEALLQTHRCTVVDCGSGGFTRVRAPRSAELFITKLTIDLRGVERVDVESYVEGYGLVKTMRDIRFDPADGALYGVCEAPLAHLSFGHGQPVRSKIVGIRDGERRVLAESELQVEFAD
jgi:hypothetical protein